MKISPLQAAEQGMNLLRDIVNFPPYCLESVAKTKVHQLQYAPQEDCECRTCEISREANNIVDRYDGEDV